MLCRSRHWGTADRWRTSNSSVIGKWCDRDDLSTTEQPSVASDAIGYNFWIILVVVGNRWRLSAQKWHVRIGILALLKPGPFLFFTVTDWTFEPDCRENAAQLSLTLDHFCSKCRRCRFKPQQWVKMSSKRMTDNLLNDVEFGSTYGWTRHRLQATSGRNLKSREIMSKNSFWSSSGEGTWKSWSDDPDAAETHELNSTGFIYAEPEYCSHNYTELTLTSRSWTGLTSLFKWDCGKKKGWLKDSGLDSWGLIWTGLVWL